MERETRAIFEGLYGEVRRSGEALVAVQAR